MALIIIIILTCRKNKKRSPLAVCCCVFSISRVRRVVYRAALDVVNSRNRFKKTGEQQQQQQQQSTMSAAAVAESMVEKSGIQVVVRLRPMSDRELKGNTLPVVTASTEKKEVTVIKGTGARTLRNTFAFDNVFTVRMCVRACVRRASCKS